MAKKYSVMAIVYDFDGTLAKGNIQENSFIPKLGITKEKFWGEVKALSKEYKMDEILAYMYLLIKTANEKKVKIRKENFKSHGEGVSYFEGVEGFFNLVNDFAKDNSVNVEHYIISSGTAEMLEGTTIKKHFKEIFASSFKYDHHGVAEWPAIAVNYTSKTQFLFRINKGIESSWDNSKINEFTPKEDRRIPFERIIYIGDGLTDVPAMSLTKAQGGCSIAVYAPRSRKKSQVEQLVKDKRANYAVQADYSKGKPLAKIIFAKIKEISLKEDLKPYSNFNDKSSKKS